MTRRRGNHEGSIGKRSDGRWEVRVTLPNGKRHSAYARTREEAREKLKALHRKLDDGVSLDSGKVKLAEFLERWLFDYVAQRVRPATYRSYEVKVRKYVAPALGHISLEKLTVRHVEAMLSKQLADGASPRSVHHHRQVLRAALNVAARWGLVSKNVAALAMPPTVPTREVRPLSPSDAKALLAAIKGDRFEAIFTVALASGLRQSEALGLRWSDIDFDSGLLSVQRTLQRANGAYRFFEPKTVRSRRTLVMPRAVAQCLREHRSRQLSERLQAGSIWEGEKWGELVFCTATGAPQSNHTLTRRLRKILREAALPEMTYHELRHGAASLMAAQGVPPRICMEILGHSQISTTMEIYAHVAPELQREAAERMDAVFA